MNKTILIVLLFLATHNLYSQTWDVTIKKTADNRAAETELGSSVVVNEDWAVAGAWRDDTNVNGYVTKTDAGAAYIYQNVAGEWVQIQKITASDRCEGAMFGKAVAMQGDYLAVGAHYTDNTTTDEGAVYIFKNNNGTWTQQHKLTRIIHKKFGKKGVIS